MATENPEEYAGAERISETLSDRFEQVRVGYPGFEDEVKILKQYGKRIEGVVASDTVVNMSVAVTHAAREMPDELERLPSVRASLSIFEQAQSLARLQNAKAVSESHVYTAAQRVLEGRLAVNTESRYYEKQDHLVAKILDISKQNI